MTEHVLTIDLGTSGPKVATFTVDGTFVDGDSAPVSLQLSAGDGAEQRPSDVEITQTFAPDPQHRAVYAPVYKEFRALHEHTKGIYARLNRHG